MRISARPAHDLYISRRCLTAGVTISRSRPAGARPFSGRNTEYLPNRTKPHLSQWERTKCAAVTELFVGKLRHCLHSFPPDRIEPHPTARDQPRAAQATVAQRRQAVRPRVRKAELLAFVELKNSRESPPWTTRSARGLIRRQRKKRRLSRAVGGCQWPVDRHAAHGVPTKNGENGPEPTPSRPANPYPGVSG